MTQHRDPGGCSVNSLPRTTNPRLSLHNSRTLILSILPLLDPRLNDCKQNFVCCSLKRIPLSLMDSYGSLTDRNPTAFHSPRLCLHLFLAVVFWVWEPSLGFRPHTSQGGSSQPRHSSGTLATACDSGTSSFCVSSLPTSLNVPASH